MDADTAVPVPPRPRQLAAVRGPAPSARLAQPAAASTAAAARATVLAEEAKAGAARRQHQQRRLRRGRMRQIELRAPLVFCGPVTRDSLGESVARVGAPFEEENKREGNVRRRTAQKGQLDDGNGTVKRTCRSGRGGTPVPRCTRIPQTRIHRQLFKKAVINCLLIEYESEIAEGGESHRLPSTGIPFHAMIDSTCRTEYPRFT